jgi:hypothetical protein
MKKYYKYEEVKDYFHDFITEQGEDWVLENKEDIHHHAFNTDYYIIGRYQARKWLGDETLNIVQIIKDYENDNFGEVSTDFSEPEHVVNMYVYILGEMIVSNIDLEQYFINQEVKEIVRNGKTRALGELSNKFNN